MVEFCIPNNRMFLFLDANGFWRENEVTRLTAKLNFMQRRNKLKEDDEIEKKFEKKCWSTQLL